jgi:hypothetical protein
MTSLILEKHKVIKYYTFIFGEKPSEEEINALITVLTYFKKDNKDVRLDYAFSPRGSDSTMFTINGSPTWNCQVASIGGINSFLGNIRYFFFECKNCQHKYTGKLKFADLALFLLVFINSVSFSKGLILFDVNTDDFTAYKLFFDNEKIKYALPPTEYKSSNGSIMYMGLIQVKPQE